MSAMHSEQRTVAEAGTRIRLRLEDGSTIKGTITVPIVNALTEDQRVTATGAVQDDQGGTWARTGKKRWKRDDGATATSAGTWSGDGPDPDEVLGNREQFAARYEEVHGEPFYRSGIQPDSGPELYMARLALKTIGEAPQKVSDAEEQMNGALRTLYRTRREHAELRYISGQDETLHPDAHLPCLNLDVEPTTLAERVRALCPEDGALVVTAPDMATRNWVSGFISTMVPSGLIGEAAGLPRVLVEATSETRRFDACRAGRDYREMVVYTVEDWDWVAGHTRVLPPVVTAADLLSGVTGVPDWAYAALTAGVQS